MKNIKRIFCYSVFLFIQNVHGYNVPVGNLGLTNILDGGPLRADPGWYWRPFFVTYHTHKFTNRTGHLLGGVASPSFSYGTFIPQFVYHSAQKLLNGNVGLDFGIPLVLFSHIEKNDLGITSSGGGFGDFFAGTYLQWSPLALNETSTFVSRLGIDFSFPCGKNEQPRAQINPGYNVYTVHPAWSATFYFTPDWAMSARLQYVWSSENSANHVKAGDVIHMNYDMEYQVIPNLWVAWTGYFLKQLTNNTLRDIEIPCSKERLLANGFGFLYTTESGYNILSYFYVESLAINHTQGIKFVFRLIKHF